MSDIKEWAEAKWRELAGLTYLDATPHAVHFAQEAYERGVNQSKFGMHLPPAVATVPGTVPLASRPASSMTIRERFAMAAMQGMLSRPNFPNAPESIAVKARIQANYLIRELEAKP